ncbi:DUF6468 domain-containing protein [Marinicauda salina]|nr:DUF6468 domain-containing protein [Marinicauda salina]
MSMAVLAFEGLVALLLLGALVMCWRVDRRLRALRSGQDGLRDTIAQLNDAVDRARASLAALDRAAKEHGGELETRVEEARQLSQELRFLNDGAEARAERLSRAPRRSRSAPAAERRSEVAAEDGERGLTDTLKTLR